MRRPVGLLLRSTFIDCNGSPDGSDSEPDGTRTARSDPGSEIASVDSFHLEKSYVAQLGEENDYWYKLRYGGPASQDSFVVGQGSGDAAPSDHSIADLDACSECSSTGHCSTFHSADKLLEGSGKRRGSFTAGATRLLRLSPSASSQPSSGSSPSHSVRWDGGDRTVGPSMTQELKNGLHASATEITEHRQKRCVSRALATIDELPSNVGEAVRKNMNELVSDLQDEVAEVRRYILSYPDDSRSASNEFYKEQAIESLDAIPGMISDTFNGSSTQVEQQVRQKVDLVIEEIGSGNLGQRQMVSQMWSIPEMVDQVAGQTMEDAVEEARMQASNQLDAALLSLPSWPTVLTGLKMRMVEKVLNMPLAKEPGHAMADMAVGTVEHAVEAIDSIDQTRFTVDASNEVVADHLLRKKVNEQEEGEVNVLHITNPGSHGHPDLCPRPCLYYVAGSRAGTCSNGNNCEFCHLPHPKRPVHLDKRHREMLKKLPPGQITAWIFQILREKIAQLELLNPEVDRRLRQIEDVLEPEIADQNTNKCMRTLLTVLKAMSVRSLLMMLARSANLECGTWIECLLEDLRDMSKFTQEVVHSPKSSAVPVEVLPALLTVMEAEGVRVVAQTSTSIAALENSSEGLPVEDAEGVDLGNGDATCKQGLPSYGGYSKAATPASHK